MKLTTTKNASTNVNVLVYGRSGVGKTRLCATAPKPLIISSESGLLSLAEYDIPVVVVTNLEELRDAYRFVARNKKATKFQTICLDSISDISESVLSSLKKTVRDPRQAYGTLNDEISSLIRKFRDLEKNTYIIAKAEPYETDEGLDGYRPAMPGRTLTRDLPYFFDEVLAMRVNSKGQRYLQTASSAGWDAKDRSGKLAEKEPPDLKLLFKKLRGGK